MKIRLRGVLTALLCGIAWSGAPPVAAGVGSSQSELVPAVHSIVLDPLSSSLVYIATDAGVFKSPDSGGNWQRVSLGLPNVSVLSLAIDPSVPSTLYAGTMVGLFRSQDAAASWTVASTGLPAGSVEGIAVDPQSPSTVFAATRFGLLRTRDGARTWSPVGPPFSRASRVVIDPQNPRTLYAIVSVAGFVGNSLFKSSDGGETWSNVSGFPTGPRGPLVGNALAIDPRSPSILYAGNALGMYKSVNGASSWFAVNGGWPCSTPIPVCVEPISLAVDPVFPETVFAGTSSSLFRTTDGGAFWTMANTGLGARRVQSLVVSPARSQRVYAGTDRGIFVSADDGASWTEANRGLTALPRLGLLQSRFSVELLAFDLRTGRSATGEPAAINDFFGTFSLAGLTGNTGNPEVFVKVLDGRAVNGHFWVFYGGLTDLEYTLTVTDTQTGRTQTYAKDFGSACGGFDTTSFPG